MDAPLSVPQLDTPPWSPLPSSSEDKAESFPRVKLALRPDDVFTTAVGVATKRTLAKWHATSPGEIVDALLALGKASEEDAANGAKL
jgi:trehalose 6-phosphate synthase/phosphatase